MWNDVSEDYFKTVSSFCRSLRFKVRRMSNEDSVMDQARRTYTSIVGRSGNLFPLLYFDIATCCMALGKSMDITRKESLLFYMTVTARDGHVTLESVQNADSALVTLVGDLAGSIGGTIEGRDTHRCSFLIETVLRNAENSKVAEYLALMNQVSNIVAKADGTVTKEEAEWISCRFGKGKERTDPLPDIIVKSAPLKMHEMPWSDHVVDKAETAISLQKALGELDRLIGLRGVKDEIHSLVNFAEAQRKRQSLGLKQLKVSMHCVFTGNPGTGKTTVARVLGRIYHGMGLLTSDKVVEVDRSALCGGFVGQTAIKTNEVIDKAIGGVLFIDEAYSLANRGENDFGLEAISTLIKRMEDDRDRLVVILAGYSDEMETFLQSNPGLRSRFSKHIRFEDYSAEELSDILSLMLKDNDYGMTDAAWDSVKGTIAGAVVDRPKDFGNARYVRNLFERILQNQADRVAFIPTVSKEILSTIELEDVANL